MSEETKINLLEIEINKISLNPGDVLLAKVKGPDFKDDEVCDTLAQSLRKVFPNNKVGVLFLDENSIEFQVISQEVAKALEKVGETEENSCNNENTCNNCNCGKAAKLSAMTELHLSKPILDDNGQPIELPPEEENE